MPIPGRRGVTSAFRSSTPTKRTSLCQDVKITPVAGTLTATAQIATGRLIAANAAESCRAMRRAVSVLSASAEWGVPTLVATWTTITAWTTNNKGGASRPTTPTSSPLPRASQSRATDPRRLGDDSARSQTICDPLSVSRKSDIRDDFGGKEIIRPVAAGLQTGSVLLASAPAAGRGLEVGVTLQLERPNEHRQSDRSADL